MGPIPMDGKLKIASQPLDSMNTAAILGSALEVEGPRKSMDVLRLDN